jgi:hypothetical protein
MHAMNTLDAATGGDFAMSPPRPSRARRLALLAASHAIALGIGFAAGVYTLPILTEPKGPSLAEVRAASSGAAYAAEFRRGLKGSDPFHWGEGKVTIGRKAIALEGRLAPGPDYKLYLVPSYVENEEEFLKVKKRSPRLGDVKTFANFVVPVPENVDIEKYDTVLVWCERFSQFITSAKYR